MEGHDVERICLGAALLNNEVWPQLAELRPDYFGLTANGLLFSCMSDMEGKFDTVTLQRELERRGQFEQVGGFGYISDLIDGIPERPDITGYVKDICDAHHKRVIASTAAAIAQLATDQATTMTALQSRVVDFANTTSCYTSSAQAIRSFADIPDLLELPAEEPKWILDGLLPQGSVTLLSGSDGVGKSHLSLGLAVAVAEGRSFLGRECSHSAVLVLDHENPVFETQARLQRVASGKNGLLRIYGNWLPEAVPQIGDPRLLEICKTVQPLMLVVDCLTFAHSADENSASEMVEVMRHLRAYAACGTCVLLLHHVSKAEGSAFRGSSAIRAACDIGITQEITDEGVLTLKVNKNRFGRKFAMTAQADFANGTFELMDSPVVVERRNDVDVICDFIQANPGLSQTKIVETLGIGRNRGFQLLRTNDGKRWKSQSGTRGSVLYYPITDTPVHRYGPVLGTSGTADSTGTPVLLPIGSTGSTGQKTEGKVQ